MCTTRERLTKSKIQKEKHAKNFVLPLDERPCNCIYPECIGKISGLDSVMPSGKLLGEIDPAMTRLDLRDKEAVVRKLVKEKLEDFQAKYFSDAGYRYEVELPWNRMFEIKVRFQG